MQLETIKLVENYCQHVLNMENGDCVDFDVTIKSQLKGFVIETDLMKSALSVIEKRIALSK